MLSATGIPFEERDLVKQPVTAEELRRYAKQVGVQALINKKGQKYKALELGKQDLSDEEWIQLLASDPDLVKRPILVIGDEVVPGLDRARIAALKP